MWRAVDVITPPTKLLSSGFWLAVWRFRLSFLLFVVAVCCLSLFLCCCVVQTKLSHPHQPPVPRFGNASFSSYATSMSTIEYRLTEYPQLVYGTVPCERYVARSESGTKILSVPALSIWKIFTYCHLSPMVIALLCAQQFSCCRPVHIGNVCVLYDLSLPSVWSKNNKRQQR